MKIRVMPHAERWRPAVEALNTRMQAGGGPTLFVDPVPQWLPAAPGRAMYREYFVAVDELDEVRGGYVLKYEPTIIAGRPVTVASVQSVLRGRDRLPVLPGGDDDAAGHARAQSAAVRLGSGKPCGPAFFRCSGCSAGRTIPARCRPGR